MKSMKLSRQHSLVIGMCKITTRNIHTSLDVTRQRSRLKEGCSYSISKFQHIRSHPHKAFITHAILENVEHCGGEPEQADTGILCHWWVTYIYYQPPTCTSIYQGMTRCSRVKDKIDILAWNAVSLPCTKSSSKADTLVCWGSGYLLACLLRHPLAYIYEQA